MQRIRCLGPVRASRAAAAMLCLCLATTFIHASAAVAAPDDDLGATRERAMGVLRTALKEEKEWVKVHAAEMLMANNVFDDVRDIFEAELAGEPGPYYRIGVWRVLAEAAASDRLNRKRYVLKIVEVYRDKNAPDREHAIESLAKLGYRDRIPEIVDAARSGEGAFQAYARWVLANGGDAEDEALFADLLASEDEGVRGNVGYGLRFLPEIGDETFKRLAEAARKEPSDSKARVYLVSALYVHGAPEDRKKLSAGAKTELIKYLRTGNREQKNEACMALAIRGETSDRSMLEAALDDPEIDVRVHAANALLRIERRQVRGLRWLDWAVIGLYGALMLGVGWYYSRKQTSTEEYFVASRNMKSSVVGISMFATLLSTISYLANPGEIIKHGPAIFTAMAAIPITFVVVGYLLIPYIMRVRITSAYEILERRLGVSVRLLGSTVFIMIRLVWMALLIFLSAKAMVAMLNWSPGAIPYVVIVAGLIAVAYTTMGGLRAVIITDLLQFFILMGGAILTLALISFKMGGVGAWFPTEWAPNWDVQPFFSLSPFVRVTVVGSVLNGLLWWVCTAGSDQVAIQRYLATRDARAARRAFLVNVIADCSVTLLLALVGFALLGFFRANPQCIPEGKDLIGDADFLFPHYIANYLPIGVAGFVVAAMFAAAMSSLDSGINSVVTVFTVDFLDRFRKKKLSETHHLKLAKYLVLVIGTMVVLLSSLVGKVPGNIQAMTAKTSNLFTAPLFGLFFLAFFVKFATPFGTIFGSAYSFLAAFLFGFWDVVTGRDPLSFQWIMPVAMLTSMTVGTGLSLIPIPKKNRRAVIVASILASLPAVAVAVWVLVLRFAH